MVRKLISEDREIALSFANENPSLNLFLIGDIENHGFESENVDFWGYFVDGKLCGVLIRYYKFFLVCYDTVDFDPSEIRELLVSWPENIEALSGEEQVMKKFLEIIPNAKIEETYFCELKDKVNIDDVDVSEVRLANIRDAQRINDLLSTIEEFGQSDANRIENSLRDKEGRIFFIESDDNKLISMAQTTAENSMSAMVIAVCTDKRYRKKGYMRKVMSKLIYDMQKENKILCLFYSNEEAGRIYHSMGFKTIGKWTMHKEKK